MQEQCFENCGQDQKTNQVSYIGLLLFVPPFTQQLAICVEAGFELLLSCLFSIQPVQ